MDLDTHPASSSISSRSSRGIDDLAAHRPVAARLVAAADAEETDARSLAAILGADVALSGRVMKLANSAYFGMRGRVTSLQLAVTVVGFTTVRTMATVALTDLADEDPAARRLLDSQHAAWPSPRHSSPRDSASVPATRCASACSPSSDRRSSSTMIGTPTRSSSRPSPRSPAGASKEAEPVRDLRGRVDRTGAGDVELPDVADHCPCGAWTTAPRRPAACSVGATRWCRGCRAPITVPVAHRPAHRVATSREEDLPERPLRGAQPGRGPPAPAGRRLTPGVRLGGTSAARIAPSTPLT